MTTRKRETQMLEREREEDKDSPPQNGPNLSLPSHSLPQPPTISNSSILTPSRQRIKPHTRCQPSPHHRFQISRKTLHTPPDRFGDFHPKGFAAIVGVYLAETGVGGGEDVAAGVGEYVGSVAHCLILSRDLLLLCLLLCVSRRQVQKFSDSLGVGSK